jgi:hypothetical protein
MSPHDTSPLLGHQIGEVKIDPDTHALRLLLDDTRPMEAKPLPDADNQRPAWQVDLPDHATITRDTEVRVKFAGT